VPPDITLEPATVVRPAPLHAAGDATEVDAVGFGAATLVEDDDSWVSDAEGTGVLAELLDAAVGAGTPSTPIRTGDLPRGCSLVVECEGFLLAAGVKPSPAPDITGTARTTVVMAVASSAPRRTRGPPARLARDVAPRRLLDVETRARAGGRCFTERPHERCDITNRYRTETKREFEIC
jgi:hypothetical protein